MLLKLTFNLAAELAAFNVKKEEEEKRQRQEHLAKRNLS
jgi:hypothetical protein